MNDSPEKFIVLLLKKNTGPFQYDHRKLLMKLLMVSRAAKKKRTLVKIPVAKFVYSVKYTFYSQHETN